MMSNQQELDNFLAKEYPHGFQTTIEEDRAPSGLTEDTIRFISQTKEEPSWLLNWRLKAFAYWKKMEEPSWAHLAYPPINYQALSYFAAPKKKQDLKSLDEVDPEVLNTFERLGIPLREQKRLAGVAVDAVFDSISVGTTFQKELAERGIIFCAFSKAIKEHPELVRTYLGSVVPYQDNYFSALNSAVFSDGSFCYIPKGVICPMELSTYFRINATNTGQFERTLIIAEDQTYVSYLEGCTAPMRATHQLHAAVVEIIAKKEAEVKYATIQNWYPGNKEGKGGIYNFVTKRAICTGDRAKVSWTQLEVGSAITWKYPSCILKGKESIGEFYSVTITKNRQQADTGTKMIHIGSDTKSRIVAKGISAGTSQNSYRGLVKILPSARGAKNFSQCDSLLIGDQCGAHTYPFIDSNCPDAFVSHEATTSKLEEEILFYCQSRGLSPEQATALLISGVCDEVLKKLPMEFTVEGRNLLNLTLEGSVG